MRGPSQPHCVVPVYWLGSAGGVSGTAMVTLRSGGDALGIRRRIAEKSRGGFGGGLGRRIAEKSNGPLVDVGTSEIGQGEIR